MTCPHDYAYASPDTFAPRKCRLCGHVPCSHAWADALDGVPRCTTCGKRAHWSPSSLETTDDCPRKGGYKARGAQPDRENPWAAFGTRSHKIRENYLRFGTWTLEIAQSAEGKCVAAGMEHWSMPRAPDLLAVELELETEVMGIPASRKHDSLARYRPGVSVRSEDLKTIGRLGASHQKTDKTLENDPQAVLYRFDSASLVRVDHVESAWTYCQRRPPKSALVLFGESPSVTRERMGDLIRPRAHALVRLRLVPLDELPRNRASCRKYGSLCEYASHCLRDLDPLDMYIDKPYTQGDGTYTPSWEDLMTGTITLGDALKTAAQAGAAQAPAPTLLPPMPGAPAPAPAPLALIPELATWVEQCAAQGSDVRAQAAEGMVQRGLWTAEQAATFVGPVVAPVPVETAPEPVAPPTTPAAEGPATAPAAAPKARGKSKAKSETAPDESPSPTPAKLRYGDRLSLLCACAAASMDSTQAEGYLALLEDGGA